MAVEDRDFASEAAEYDGMWDDEEPTDDDGTPVQEDAEDVGEPGSQDGDDEADEPTQPATDEPTFEVTLPGGEKAAVPLSELVAGYSRTADYTRKTQALAQERKTVADAVALTQALERNPQAALAALARAYGVDGQGQQPDADGEYLSEEEQWRREVDAERAEMRRARQEAQIEREISRLHGSYGDFDEEALFTHAVQTNTMNLEIALQSLLFGRHRQTAEQKAQAQRNAKRAAGAASGSRSSAVAKPVVEDGEINSFRDAYEYAKRLRDARS